MALVTAMSLTSAMTAASYGALIIAQIHPLRHTDSASWISLRGIANATSGRREEVMTAATSSA